LEAWHNDFPEHQIVISFFSPSGFEVRKNYFLAAKVCYLPLDQPKSSRDFIEALNPKMAFFTKYDFWYFYFRELRKRNIPIIVLSSIFRPRQIYFKPWGGFFRKILGNVSYFFVQNQDSVDLLKSIGINRAWLTGDTRFDRVLKISQNPMPLNELNAFVFNNQILVAGSSWPKDEIFIRKLMDQENFKNWKCFLVPHEIDTNHLEQIDSLFDNHSVRYSEWILDPESPLFRNKKIMVIDQIGLLSSLYKMADLAYIGNGFGSGIHNTLEAAVFGKPLIFGPNYLKFKEARDLIQLNSAFSFADFEGLKILFKNLQDPQKRKESGEKAKKYCLDHTGATEKIIRTLKGDFMPSPYPPNNPPKPDAY